MISVIDSNYVIYENDNFADKYTAIHRKHLFILGFNSAPYHPQGIGQYCGEFTINDDIENLDHLGKKINAEKLNDDCQNYLLQNLDDSDIQNIVKIYFDKNNCNVLVFEKDSKKYYIAIPPSKNTIDVYCPSGITKQKILFTESYYLHNTDSFVIITDDTERKVFQKGKLICKTKLTY